MKKVSELEIIAMIREMAGGGRGIVSAIGDDCAVLARPAGRIVVTTDTLASGVHFDPAWHPPLELGKKCAAVNLSDIAAMGAEPVAAFLSLALPEGDAGFVRAFMQGLLAVLEKHGCTLAGGDTVRSPVHSFTLTVIGEEGKGGVVERSGAAAGDAVMVSGPLGCAAAGLELFRLGRADAFPSLRQAHLVPEPRLALGRFLADSGMVTAMMDISDGLSLDLARLCRESGTGAEIDAAVVPMTAEFRRACAEMKLDPVELALCGGDDYELLFTVAADKAEELSRRAREQGHEIFRIGRMTETSGVVLLSGDRWRELAPGGYDHFREG